MRSSCHLISGFSIQRHIRFPCSSGQSGRRHGTASCHDLPVQGFYCTQEFTRCPLALRKCEEADVHSCGWMDGPYESVALLSFSSEKKVYLYNLSSFLLHCFPAFLLNYIHCLWFPLRLAILRWVPEVPKPSYQLPYENTRRARMVFSTTTSSPFEAECIFSDRLLYLRRPMICRERGSGPCLR